MVLRDESSTRPTATKRRIILEEVRLPPEILPIMGIKTKGFIMFFCERAPFSFEIEHVEILIDLQQMNQFYLHVCK
jgi:hypothetical protein